MSCCDILYVLVDVWPQVTGSKKYKVSVGRDNMNNDILENILQEFSKVNGRLDKIDNRLDKVENQQEVCSRGKL